jgi:hypothetical protein
MNIASAQRVAQRDTEQRDDDRRYWLDQYQSSVSECSALRMQVGDLKARVLYLETQNAALEESLRIIALSTAKP